MRQQTIKGGRYQAQHTEQGKNPILMLVFGWGLLIASLLTRIMLWMERIN